MRPTLVTAIAVLTLTVITATAGCGGAAARPQGKTARVAAAGPSTAAAPSTPPAQSAQPDAPAPLARGRIGTLAQVPWGQIGAGWALAEYTTGSGTAAAPVMLYIVDPEGGLYQVYRWAATTQPWFLISWSGDKSRVLLEQPGASPPSLHQLTLASGEISTFTLPSTVTQVIGYTRPAGENILAWQDSGLARYSLTGALQARLTYQYGFGNGSAVSSADGLTEVASDSYGVQLVSNAGGMIRFLPVLGVDGSCTPERWWNAADVLVSCRYASTFEPRLWLVPVSGAPALALTPARTAGEPDFGDVDAWQLPTGLYLEAQAGCGAPFVAKELSGSAVQAVSPASVVIATSDDLMLVQQYSECEMGSSLAWLNPATSSAQRVLTALPNSTGVVSAIAFDGDGEQPPSQA